MEVTYPPELGFLSRKIMSTLFIIIIYYLLFIIYDENSIVYKTRNVYMLKK